ncbi:hypothetical protein T10_13267 [Trichinella papuae]|uniref:Uncharacterized protein n=1 Tax=Trichinella papuae TaxID=268474 RepID=A0A0V1M1C6_9BILA|nr:hypothetical protein T10_13267 [Trichinella papuae]
MLVARWLEHFAESEFKRPKSGCAIASHLPAVPDGLAFKNILMVPWPFTLSARPTVAKMIQNSGPRRVGFWRKAGLRKAPEAIHMRKSFWPQRY